MSKYTSEERHIIWKIEKIRNNMLKVRKEYLDLDELATKTKKSMQKELDRLRTNYLNDEIKFHNLIGKLKGKYEPRADRKRLKNANKIFESRMSKV